MKYFVTPSTDLINDGTARDWGIDRVFVSSEFNNGLYVLPEEKDNMKFFIPTVFTYQNSLNYDGVTLALKILFHYLRKGRTDVDIILVGNESEIEFLLHYSYPNILKIPGVSYLRLNKKRVRDYECPQRSYIKREDYTSYLENLGLKLPSSFKSTHSLTNEWCLYKWNSFMGFNETISGLEGHLYFDYLITIEKLNKVKDKKVSDHLLDKIKSLPAGTRILLIDDKEGWHKFFKEMFMESKHVELSCIGQDFNKLQFLNIEMKIKETLKDFKPNIIILDFRLMEDKDAEVKDNMKKISGYKILSEVIKGTYNKPLDYFGCQVFIFTATSRIENILMLKSANADGFILKERPETYSGKEITKDLISKMISNIQIGIERANFLIPINKYFKDIEALLEESPTDFSVELKQTINNEFSIVRNLYQTNKLSIDVLESSYITIFNIFEEIKRDSHFVQFPNDYTLIIHGEKDITVCNQKDSWIKNLSGDDMNFTRDYNIRQYREYCKDGGDMNFAISALLLFRLGYRKIEETDWSKIRKLRNAIVHNNDSSIIKIGLHRDIKTLQFYIIKMLKLIQDILDKNQIKVLE